MHVYDFDRVRSQEKSSDEGEVQIAVLIALYRGCNGYYMLQVHHQYCKQLGINFQQTEFEKRGPEAPARFIL